MAWPNLNLGGAGRGLNLGGQSDPNAAYQMPQVPWAQNPMITTAALGLLGGRTLNEGLQNVAQNAPAGLAAKTAMQRDMYSLQEKARTDAEAKAEQARQRAAMNVGLKLRSGIPLASLTPAEQAAWAAAPEIALKLSEPQVLAEGSRVWNPLSGPPPAGGAAPPKPSDVKGFRQEIVARPAFQKVAEAEPIYRSMVETYPRKTRVSDLNLVYGLAKIMDPGSVVKEGEQIAVRNTAALPDWVLGQINWVNGKNELQDATRQSILTEAKSRMDAYQTEWQHERKYWEGAAGRGGFAQEDIPSFAPLPELPFTISNNPYPVPPDPNL